MTVNQANLLNANTFNNDGVKVTMGKGFRFGGPVTRSALALA
jgi:hypothetical protein